MHTPSYLTTTAQAYDGLADAYADFARDGLDKLTLDRSIITAFADLVLEAKTGPVGDLGCGPGYVSAFLHERGLQVFGVDLSLGLIRHARERCPDLQFSVGSMAELDAADESLGGIVTWYSLIHTPPAEVPAFFAEFHRALAAGGHLLLGFFEAEGEPVTPFDHAVTTAYRWPIDELAEIGHRAGFEEVGRMLRKPLDGERFQRGHLLLRK